MRFKTCEQCLNALATVYAIDPLPGGWGGYYCIPCQEALRFQIVDRLEGTANAADEAGS